MTCPEPEALCSLVDDTLPAELRAEVEDHLDGCDECRSTVALLAHAQTAEQASARIAASTDLGHAPTGIDPRLGLESTALGGEAFDATAVAVVTAVDRPSVQRRAILERAALKRGTKVGRYVIGEPLGIGGMGIVYTAHDPDLHRDVAIKILRPEFARAHPDSTRRIIREARSMARLAHPNVVSVYDVGTVDDQVFVAMERISGMNLREWLDVALRSTAEILEVFTAAGRGVIAAHDAGMVHRDFKPDNVLVGADGRVRVTDFGLAYDHTDDLDVGESGAPSIAGTPAYMAPEQHEGGNLDARSDQFSFAVALYEALYGTRPFAGTTRVAFADAVLHGRIEPAPPKSRVPASLRAILVRALSVTPGDRFPTLDELLKALGRDRGRRPRQVAFVAFVAFVAVAIAFGADGILQERTRAVTRTSFAAARAQLDKLVSLRADTFAAQSDALYLLPGVQAVAASPDFADFGLGEESEDKQRRETARAALRSQSWLEATRLRQTDVVAIADQKGRLLFSSANTAVWDTDVTSVPVIAAAYDAPTEVYLGVVKGDDPVVVESNLMGGRPRPGLFVVFARTKRINGQAKALFVQFVEAARVLKEVSTGTDALLSVTALGGEAEGGVPRGVLDGATSTGIAELTVDQHEWLAERTPLRANDQADAIAQLVLARRTDVGLAGLFPYARGTLAVMGILLGALAVGGFLLARARDLGRVKLPGA